MAKDYEMMENVRFDQGVADHLIRYGGLSVAFREAWGNKACIRSIHGQLRIFRASELRGYPFALSFDDLMASDWAVG